MPVFGKSGSNIDLNDPQQVAALLAQLRSGGAMPDASAAPDVSPDARVLNDAGRTPYVTGPTSNGGGKSFGNPPSAAAEMRKRNGIFGALPAAAVMGAAPVANDINAPNIAPANVPARKPGFFEDGGVGQKIAMGLSAIAPNLVAMGGQPELAAQMMQMQAGRQRDAQNRALEMWKYQMQQSAPDTSVVGGNLVSYRKDGTGGVRTLYEGKSDAAKYADTVAKPGTPAWDTAFKDFSLRDIGPTGMQWKQTQMANDNANSAANRGVTMRGQNMGSADAAAGRGVTMRGQDLSNSLGTARLAYDQSQPNPGRIIAPILAKQAQGLPLSPGERDALQSYRPISMSGVIGNMAAGLTGGAPMHTGASPAPASSPPAGPANRKRYSPSEAAKLPPGAWFFDINGNIRQKH